MPEALVHVLRGKVVEAVHYGDVAVVDHHGDLVFSRGNPENVTFLRSAAKPIQAAAALLKLVDVSYDLDDEEVALLCSSHSGERSHVRIAERVMKKLGLGLDDLKCDSSFPMDKDMTHDMISTGMGKSPLYNNCSGKHMAMLAICNLMAWDKATYYKPEHPLQKYFREVIGKFCGSEWRNILMACDGCGVPVHGMSVRKMAIAYERLATANFEDGQYREACRKVVRVMSNHPFVIAGSGRFDYILSEAFKGGLIAKTGAEGVFCVGIPDAQIGIAVKIHDGSQRGMEAIVLRVLDLIDCLPVGPKAALMHLEAIGLHNHRNEEVGRIVPAF